MRAGIMGGTLDPVHNGHLEIAQAAFEELKLDSVILLPAGVPPHKTNVSSGADRFSMAQIAASGYDWLSVGDTEILRQGTTYTVDTLTEFRKSQPGTEWFYIIGADTLDVLDTWKDFGAVAKMCVFAVVSRAHQDIDTDRIHMYEQRYGAAFSILSCRGPDISSTDIRKRINRGAAVSDLIPSEVASYIEKRGLYLCSIKEEEIIRRLKNALKPSRYEHVLGVADTCVKLARKFSVPEGKAYTAGILHDCAKSISEDELLRMVAAHTKDTDEKELAAGSILHAPAGAYLAKKEYGVHDKEILSAIRKHTIGDPSMSALDALVYTADFIEPNRKAFAGLQEVRALAEKDIFQAMVMCAELTSKYLLSQGKEPHPKTLKMIEKYSIDRRKKYDRF